MYLYLCRKICVCIQLMYIGPHFMLPITAICSLDFIDKEHWEPMPVAAGFFHCCIWLQSCWIVYTICCIVCFVCHYVLLNSIFRYISDIADFLFIVVLVEWIWQFHFVTVDCSFLWLCPMTVTSSLQVDHFGFDHGLRPWSKVMSILRTHECNE